MTRNYRVSGLRLILLVSILGVGVLRPTLANAEDTSQGNILPYKHTMRCAAYNIFMAGILEKEGAVEAKSFFDDGARWLTMAYARDGEEGEKAQRDLDVVLDKLLKKIETLGETEIEEFLTEVSDICTGLAKENSEEFNSISLE